jgi:hypothetical protein
MSTQGARKSTPLGNLPYFEKLDAILPNAEKRTQQTL